MPQRPRVTSVTASDIRLSGPCLVGMILSLSVAPLHLTEPSPIQCRASLYCFCPLLHLSICVLIFKVNRMSTAALATSMLKRVRSMSSWRVNHRWQLCFAVVATLIGLAMTAVADTFSPSSIQTRATETGGNVTLCVWSTAARWSGTGYLLAMLLVASFLVYPARKLPRQFNESANIWNASVSLISIWLFGMLLLDVIYTQHRPVALVMLTCMHNFLLWASLYAPRLCALAHHFGFGGLLRLRRSRRQSRFCSELLVYDTPPRVSSRRDCHGSGSNRRFR